MTGAGLAVVGGSRQGGHRPPGGGSVWFRVGECHPGPIPPALRHRRRSAQSVRGAQVPCGTGCQATCHQVLISRAPHRTRCLLLAPACRALWANVLLVGFVSGQQRPPPLGEPRQLGTRHGEKGRGVGAVRQLGQHIEPLPHRVAQHLTQYLIHRTSPSLSRLLSGFPQRRTQPADSISRQHRGFAGRPRENHPVPVDEHGEKPVCVHHIPAVHFPPATRIGANGCRFGRTVHRNTPDVRFRFPGTRLLEGVHC